MKRPLGTKDLGLTIILSVSVLAFGTVEPWSNAGVQLMILGLFLFWLSDRNRDGSLRYLAPGISLPGLLPAGLFLLYLVFQVLPLPATLLNLLSPSTLNTWKESLRILPDLNAGHPAGEPSVGISLYRRATWLGIHRALACLGVYVLTAHLLKDRLTLQRHVQRLCHVGLALSVLAIVQHVSGNGKIFWFREVPEGAQPFGPYVSKNHFAGFIELLLPLNMAYLLYILPRFRTRGVRYRVVEFLTLRELPRIAGMLISAVVMAGALFMCVSRAGVVSLMSGMIVLVTALFVSDSLRPYARRAALPMLLLVLIGAWIGWGPIMDRFELLSDVQTEHTRLTVWADTLEIIKNYTIPGTGAGTFEYVYPAFKTVASDKVWDYAHNDYLQQFAETGLAGIVIILGLAAAFLAWCIRRFGLTRSRLRQMICLGAASGLAGIAVHGLVDFNLHIGANQLIAAHLAGLMAAALVSGRERASVKEPERTMRRGSRIGLRVASLVVFLGCTVWLIRPVLGDAYFKTALSYPAGSESSGHSPRISMLERAASVDPGDFRYPYALGRELILENRKREAGEQLHRALVLSPTSPDTALIIAHLYEREGLMDGAVRATRRAQELAPCNDGLRLRMALLLRAQGLFGEALEQYGTAMVCRPDRTPSILSHALGQGFGIRALEPHVPKDTESQTGYALALWEEGHGEEARRILESLLSGEEGRAPAANRGAAHVYDAMARICEESGDVDREIKVLAEATNRFPLDFGFQVRLARAYEKRGDSRLALSRYQRALQHYPNALWLQGKINSLLRVVGEP